jgi:hypothetical protein
MFFLSPGAVNEAASVPHTTGCRGHCLVASRPRTANRQRAAPWCGGVVMSAQEDDPEGKAQLSGFTQALAGLGWIDGRNLRMEVRWGGGDVNRARTYAKELVALQPDVILAQGTPVTAALQRESRTIPIVFVVVSRGWIRCGTSSPGREYHRLPNIGIRNNRQDA